MPRKPRKPDAVSQADWDAVDSPPLTRKALSELRAAREVLPAVVARATRGPGKKPKKKPISIRLDQSVLEAFRATGDGWQRRINATLARDVAEGRIFNTDGRLIGRSKAKEPVVRKAKAAAVKKRA